MGPRRARAGGAYRAFVPTPWSDTGSISTREWPPTSPTQNARRRPRRRRRHDSGPNRLESSRDCSCAPRPSALRRSRAWSSARAGSLSLTSTPPSIRRTSPRGRGQPPALREALDLATRPGPSPSHGCARSNAVSSLNSRRGLGGVVRAEPNWIGGHTPLDAEYVPRPQTRSPRCSRISARTSRDDHPPWSRRPRARPVRDHPPVRRRQRPRRARAAPARLRAGCAGASCPPRPRDLVARYVAALTATRVAGEPDATAVIAGDSRGSSSWPQQPRRVPGGRPVRARVAALVDGWRARSWLPRPAARRRRRLAPPRRPARRAARHRALRRRADRPLGAGDRRASPSSSQPGC